MQAGDGSLEFMHISSWTGEHSKCAGAYRFPNDAKVICGDIACRGNVYAPGMQRTSYAKAIGFWLEVRIVLGQYHRKYLSTREQ